MTRRPCFAFLLCLLTFAALRPACAQTYNLQDLHTYGDNPFRNSDAKGINDNGVISCESYEDYSFDLSLVWQNGNFTAIPDPMNSQSAYTGGINNNGSVVGTGYSSFDGGSAYVYSNGVTTNLTGMGTFPSCAAINDAGQIVGSTDINGYAFIYKNGNITNLGFLPNNDTSLANAINNANPVEVAGQSGKSGTAVGHATLWKNGVKVDLGTFGGPDSIANGINDQGQIVGQADTAQKDANGFYYHHAFLWTPNTPNGTTGTMTDLGTLGAGLDSSAAAINNDGTVVGSTYTDANDIGSTAFVWDAANGMKDLYKLLVSANLDVPYDTYYLQGATGINSRGQICGTYEGYYGGTSVYHGFVLAPTGGVAPAAPNGLAAAPAAQVASSNTVNLTWHSNSFNETGFLVERETGTSGTFLQVGTTGAYVQSYTDATAQPSTTYTYRVRATNTYGTSAPSNTASATTGPSSVTLSSLAYSPTSVVAGKTSTGTVTLTGNAPNGGSNVNFTLDGAFFGNLTVPAGSNSTTYTQDTSALTAGAHTFVAQYNHTSKTATLTVTSDSAKPKPVSLTYSPNPVASGGTTTGTVTLSAAAPSGGAAVTISENGTALGAITVPAGKTGVTYTLTVGAAGSYTDAATYNGKQVTTTLTVTGGGGGGVTLTGVALNPTSVTGGSASTGTITLSGAAPAGGALVKLASSIGAATVPASVTVAAGATTKTFTVNTTSVTATKTATITATYSGVSKTATLTINTAAASPPSITSLSPNTATAGSAAFTLTVNGANFVSGAVVKWSGAALTTTFVSASKLTAAVPASDVKTAGTYSIKVLNPDGQSSAASPFTVTAGGGKVVPKTLVFTPNPAYSSGQSKGTVTLSGAAPAGGAAVSISYNGTVFTTATVAAGATSAVFYVNWGAVTTSATYTMGAAYNGTTVTTSVTVKPTSVTIVSLAYTPNPVTGGQNTVGKVKLSAAAPAGGAVITLSGAVSYSFVVPAGATSATYTQPTGTVTQNTTYTFHAAYNGASVDATLTATP